MAVIGPGAQPTTTTDNKSLLDGASEFEYVRLLNPLDDDFAVRVAQDLPVNMPFPIGKDDSGNTSQLTNTEADARQVYGLSLKNRDFQGRKHVFMDTIIKAGSTKVFKGNEAQVAIRQLTNEILQNRGHKRLLADPTLRREVEQEIIKERGAVQDLMDAQLQTPRSQMDKALEKVNEVQDESAFPDVQPQPESFARGPGRPKKTVNSTNNES